jgi:hypothetical protein
VKRKRKLLRFFSNGLGYSHRIKSSSQTPSPGPMLIDWPEMWHNSKKFHQMTGSGRVEVKTGNNDNIPQSTSPWVVDDPKQNKAKQGNAPRNRMASHALHCNKLTDACILEFVWSDFAGKKRIF